MSPLRSVKLAAAIQSMSFLVLGSVILFSVEEAMLHLSHSVYHGPPLAIAALLAFVTPAGAGVALNGVALNGVALNGVSTSGSALGDLNGVAVEAVIIPDAANR